MKRTITATELKQNLGAYLDFVMAHHEIVVTKNGKNAVRISPYLTDYESYHQLKEDAAEYLLRNPKVSYEEFMQIYEKTELRLEYLNGVIVLLSSPSTDHQLYSGNLYVLLRSHLEGSKCKVFYAPFDVHFFKKGITDPDVLQPDLVVACDLEGNVQNGRYMGTPTLVIEILSPSTRSKDMVDKLNSYMLSGVEEYWIVDPISGQIMVYSFADLNIDGFDSCRSGDTILSTSLAGLSVNVDDVFAL